MARDKTDKTDLTPVVPQGPYPREEIEKGLDGTVRKILTQTDGTEAIQGWPELFRDPVYWLRTDKGIIPTVTEERAAQLVHLAESDCHAFDASSYLAAAHFDTGCDTGADRFPPSLRRFGLAVLLGQIKRPRQYGRPLGDDVELRLLQFSLCHFVAKAASLPLSRNRSPSGPENFSACDAVADAFSRAGRHTTQAQMASLCYDKGSARIRAVAYALALRGLDDAK